MGKNVMFGAVFVVTVVLGVWIWMKMAKVKKVLLEEQAGRREKALMEEMEEADRKAAERRVEVSEPRAAFGGVQGGLGSPRRGEWGYPEQRPQQEQQMGRMF